MAMDDDAGSCSSRLVDSTAKQPRHHRQKLEAYHEVLRRVQEWNYEEANLPGFDDQLWHHFDRLPAGYAFDVNVERAEDVLAHKRLLALAKDSANGPVFDIRPVQVHSAFDSNHWDPSVKDDAQSSANHSAKHSVHPPPTFGSAHNLEALAQANRVDTGVEGSDANSNNFIPRPMHEITFSTIDRPKLLATLTSLLSDLGLNIQEAHAFSTTDGYSLDVFVVDGWSQEGTEELKIAVESQLLKTKDKLVPTQPLQALVDQHSTLTYHLPSVVDIPNDGVDVWEINSKQLKVGDKVAAGSFGDLYKGTYCSQEVAVKILKPERVNADMLREFSQEVFIMRKIRHKNVVQFIGACTQSPNLCIVTEFMSRGSLYDFLHKQKGKFDLPTLLKVAIDASKGMNYLHQNNIIHRDLKTANLLMDEYEVVKVADFGVARVQVQSGVMTAETGTYRWMAPEVIEHRAYNHKADIFSFGILLWELLTGELPYSQLTPLQAAVGVVQKCLRPAIPKDTHPKLAALLEECWQQDPALRPNFSEIIQVLQDIAKEAGPRKGTQLKQES
ncbi:hypothetical protein QQ045_024709 [Rhodiola kirilowii]